MRFSRLRLVGFKSFVDPAEFVIEPGLTGIVGPNGCGKSNLVEGLRWVMGESSYRAMRASGMDDVIFAGSAARPGRNSAEVVLVIDNEARRAPAAFNDAEVLEVARRIERDAGSAYRINGREARARDVQMLFADASTGARSPSLVRQGQIAELIAAKPQARRLVLEEAAGIAGLHARRQEAESRLKAAEQNLARIEDVLNQLKAQLDGLKRQSRQAARYRSLSAEIRRLEATLALIRWSEARHVHAETERNAEAETRRVAELTRAASESARARAVAAHGLQALRGAAEASAERVAKLVAARAALDGEERRVRERLAEIESRLEQFEADAAHQVALSGEAEAALARLAEEDARLVNEAEAAADATAARRALAAAEDRARRAEQALRDAEAAAAGAAARRAERERARREAALNRARLEAELRDVEAERSRFADLAAARAQAAGCAAAARTAAAEAARLEAAMEDAEARLRSAREQETAGRGRLAEAERKAQRLETEARTLRKLLVSAHGRFRPVLDSLSVAKGYETALGAALGEDLEASLDAEAPAHWSETESADDPMLPDGVEPLLAFVDAPAALRRRLGQIGVAPRADGKALQRRLRPGQRLVSLEGDLWRWDGFTVAADAPTPAAQRLAERNRLDELEAGSAAARAVAESLRAEHDARQTGLRTAAEAEVAARAALKAAQARARAAGDESVRAERTAAQAEARGAALAATSARLAAGLDEARAAEAALDAALAALDEDTVQARLPVLGAALEAERRAAGEARNALARLEREAAVRAARLEALRRDAESWRKRIETAARQAETLGTRRRQAEDERAGLEDAPGRIFETRRVLLLELDEAEAARRAAADRLAAGERALAEADRAGRDCDRELGDAREAQARAETRLEAARERLAEAERHARERFDVAPMGLYALADLKPGHPFPPAPDLDSRLEALRRDRERLGPVNLRAEAEAHEVEVRHGALLHESEDLVEAIRRLRQGIATLNREGRERLTASFGQVDAHFRSLFGTLFGGGTAELLLVESDDPLEAGLEIVARPPGKRPQTLTLLSGGEQALTALSLIFAVFLTNPSPICVLDEVDAPLDDANVERFCDLLDEMRRRTDTRFLIITHNPLTMARMDRLYGVTMAERGVSSLVSVDLETAERFREAG